MSYNEFENAMIDAAAYAPDDERPNDEPGDCPFCGGAIRFSRWIEPAPAGMGTGYYHCTGCGCNWSDDGQVEYDRRILRSGDGLTAVNDNRIDEHLAAVDAAEMWAGEPPF